MIKFCLNQWNKNKDKLEKVIQNDKSLNGCNYDYLVKLVVDNILNDEDSDYGDKYDSKAITVIDNGDYQGTQLFMIPTETYQPCEYEYLLTYQGYGSCSGCDTLQSIQDYHYDELPDDKQVKGFMSLCKDLVCNMIKPYNTGWRDSDKYSVVEIEV